MDQLVMLLVKRTIDVFSDFELRYPMIHTKYWLCFLSKQLAGSSSMLIQSLEQGG